MDCDKLKMLPNCESGDGTRKVPSQDGISTSNVNVLKSVRKDSDFFEVLFFLGLNAVKYLRILSNSYPGTSLNWAPCWRRLGTLNGALGIGRIFAASSRSKMSACMTSVNGALIGGGNSETRSCRAGDHAGVRLLVLRTYCKS